MSALSVFTGSRPDPSIFFVGFRTGVESVAVGYVYAGFIAKVTGVLASAFPLASVTNHFKLTVEPLAATRSYNFTAGV